jgi:sterol desaturase/sphingolipid hydroxylase (fatty acid hydroxylase superfamily)
LAGFFAWTLLEYFIHRYLFHLPGEYSLIKKFRYMMHGVHHDYPADKRRLIMPPLPWIMYAALLTGFFYLFMGGNAFPFMAGVLLGYCVYVFIHYSIHTDRPPGFLRKQRIHHSLHHYRFPDHAFGVSSNLWDRVFGTMPPVGSKERKPDKLR